jgi:hypothetical protein
VSQIDLLGFTPSNLGCSADDLVRNKFAVRCVWLNTRRAAMKAGLRNFILSPLFVVLAAAVGWTTGYFFTWQMRLVARLAFGAIAAAVAVALVLWALKGVAPQPKTNRH